MSQSLPDIHVHAKVQQVRITGDTAPGAVVTIIGMTSLALLLQKPKDPLQVSLKTKDSPLCLIVGAHLSLSQKH